MRLYRLLRPFIRLNSLHGNSSGQQQQPNGGNSMPQNTLAKNGKPMGTQFHARKATQFTEPPCPLV